MNGVLLEDFDSFHTVISFHSFTRHVSFIFSEYMTNIGAQGYLFFYLTIEVSGNEFLVACHVFIQTNLINKMSKCYLGICNLIEIRIKWCLSH